MKLKIKPYFLGLKLEMFDFNVNIPDFCRHCTYSF